MMKEIELHLVDAAAPSGEIAIKDLAASRLLCRN